MKSELSISFYRCNVVSVQTGSGFTHTYVSRHKQIQRDVICKSLILKVKVTFLLLFFFIIIFYFKTVLVEELTTTPMMHCINVSI